MSVKKRILLIVMSLLFLVIMFSEVVFRIFFGLGNPPLSVADPEIEYLFKPSSDYRRFGKDISYNKFSMRSEDFSKRKENPKELRVLLVGDSVINGGSHTDQNDLASKLLERDLSVYFHRPVVVANISAGSWGPPNQLAYLKRFGLFDANVIAIILSSHDYNDVPTFKTIVGVDENFPDHKPVFALQEVFSRYLPRLLHLKKPEESTVSNAEDDPKNPAIVKAALREIFNMAKKSGVEVILAQYLEREEVMGKLKPGHAVILGLAHSSKISDIQIGPIFKEAIQHGKNPYYDAIHPNKLGQRLIEKALEKPLITALEKPLITALEK